MENQLQVIVRESGLDSTKAEYILRNFQNYFELAAEWEKKAKTIIVTSGDQKEAIAQAREGRLELKEKRVAIEKSRKELKEQSLREGKAIDGIANVLKALIVPIEDYLEQQERFVDIQEEKKAEARRLEVERRIAEEDRIAAERAAEAAKLEQERVRLENERLRAEAQEREKKMDVERAEALRKQQEIENKAAADRKVMEDKAKAERAEQEKKLAAARAIADKAKKEMEEKAKKQREKLEAERKEKERLESLLKDQITCPHCHKKFVLEKELA